ncbi:MAG: flavodoxin family protein [Chloroflexi bacterium]|nr:flavodoxin family protein [Chloroflexota bacterium]
MRILGINGSQRKDGNCYLLLKSAFEGVKEEEVAIETEMLLLADFEIKPCKACYSGVEEVVYYGCAEKPHRCIIQNDDFEYAFQKMVEADGLIACVPLYTPIPAKFVALIERLMMIVWSAGEVDKDFKWPLSGKPFSIIGTSFDNSTDAWVLKPLRKYAWLLRFYQPRIDNQVFSVDAKGGARKPKNLEEAKKLGSLVARTLIKREKRKKR